MEKKKRKDKEAQLFLHVCNFETLWCYVSYPFSGIISWIKFIIVSKTMKFCKTFLKILKSGNVNNKSNVKMEQFRE